MRANPRVVSIAVLSLFALVSAAPAPAPSPPAAQKPAPEYALLKRDEGVWNATIQMAPEPGGEAEVSNGVETNVIGPGGLWLITDFKGQLMGKPFQGHGILGYDEAKKKFLRVWVDSTQAVLFPPAGRHHPGPPPLSLVSEGPPT